jgi:regulator of cell morphogenesis and NO signaling
MTLFTPHMKLADVVHSNYLLLPVIGRFGIPLGFGEKTVAEACAKYHIDVVFFLTILNAFSNPLYFPQKRLQAFDVLTIISYLRKTHAYYRDALVPRIEGLLGHLVDSSTSGRRKLIATFFSNYKKELFAHLNREEELTFPYIERVCRFVRRPEAHAEEKDALSRYSMDVYEEEHSDIDEKLYDLKSILIKLVWGGKAENICSEVIFELFRLEQDIRDHTRIENTILMPVVAEMEKALGPGKSRGHRNHARSVGKSAKQARPPLRDPVPDLRSARTNDEQPVPPGLQPMLGQDREDLSPRELEVLQLVACGYLNKQIADKLSISLHTVISHRKNITRKLQIKTVAGLTMYAALKGLISSPEVPSLL